MASTRTGFEDQNVLSQVVASLASMGYQVHQFIMDAWNYGSAQQRSRVFLTIAAPGLEPMVQPWHTHSRPVGETVGKSLGRLPNNQKFGEREHYPTPFPALSAGAITSDLPDIGNGNVQTCISHLDHRVPYQPGQKDRALLQCIPRQPPGSGYTEAFRLGLIPESLLKPGKENGKSFRRIKEAGLVPTITTCQSVQDSRNGAVVHWAQDRPITILEARRTQGWPDEEPIIGSPVEQYKIVGNGVDRKVSFALGLGLRQALEQNVKRRKVPTISAVPAEEVLVDAEGDLNDTASVASNIDVHVPPQPQASARARTLAMTLEQPLPGIDVLGLDDDKAADIPDNLGFYGTSDDRNDVSVAIIPATFRDPSATTSLLSRLTATVANGLGGLAFRSRPSLSAAAPSTVHGKRSREDESLDDVDCGASHGSSNGAISSKRVKTKDTTQPTTLKSETNGVTPGLAKARRVEAKKRSTRHSGLEATFYPKQWNKRPEHEYSAVE